MHVTPHIIAIIILLFCSAFFSGSEAALISLSRLKVRHLIKQKRAGAKIIQKLKDDPDRLLSTVLIGNNLVNVAISVIATEVVIMLYGDNVLGITTGVMTLVLLIFGEITPKSFAIRHNEKMGLIVAQPIWVLSIVFSPLIRLLKIITTAISPKTKKPVITQEELRNYIEVSEEEGILKAIEKKMIQRIIDFDAVAVREVMTQKKDMVSISADAKLSELAALIIKKPYSRFPVYEQNKNTVIGTVYIKNMFRHVRHMEQKTVRDIMSKPFIVAEHKKIDAVLLDFQKRKEHIALVADKHGSISGLITLEDVLEEIVGEIMDETDKMAPRIVKTSPSSWRIEGKAYTDDLNEKIGMGIPEDEFDTLNGFIVKKLSRSPRNGDIIKYGSFEIVVDNVNRERAEVVTVVKK